MKDDTQINTTKRTRAPKQSTGTMLWIPATCLIEVKAIVDRDAAMRKAQAAEKLRQRVQRDTERLKALATDDTVNQQLNPIGVNPAIDPTQNLQHSATETLPEMAYTNEPEYLTDTPETPVTGYKQAEWCGPAIVPPNQRA